MLIEEVPYKNYPILVVDDEEYALLTFQNVFKQDFTIYLAENGEAALKMIDKHPDIALVLSDQKMPGMDGLTLITRISHEHPEMINMLVTAYTDLSLVIEAINHGNLYRYIVKPYDEREMRHILVQGIERFHLSKERDRLYLEHLESVRMESEMKRLTELGTMMAGVSHDINNSLVAVSSFLGMIPQKREEGESGEKNTDFWQDFYFVTLNELARIQEMVDHLVRCTALSGKEDLVTLKLKETDLNKVLYETILLVEHEAHLKGIEVRQELDMTLPHCQIEGGKIREVFMNLLFNAIAATSQGFILVKSFKSDEYYARVSIQDTGVGISKENLAKLFIPFFSTKTNKNAGVGLGLMMCRDIVEKHRGHIDVKSEVGIGTTITVSLPISSDKHDRRSADRRAS